MASCSTRRRSSSISFSRCLRSASISCCCCSAAASARSFTAFSSSADLRSARPRTSAWTCVAALLVSGEETTSNSSSTALDGKRAAGDLTARGLEGKLVARVSSARDRSARVGVGLPPSDALLLLFGVFGDFKETLRPREVHIGIAGSPRQVMGEISARASHLTISQPDLHSEGEKFFK